MKHLKILLLTIGFATVSLGIVAMEPANKPKVFIKNENTYSRVRSGGVLCLINKGIIGNEKNIFIEMGQQQTMIGTLGTDTRHDIVTLGLQPSTSGTGKTGWVFSPEMFPLTEKLNEMLKQIGQHPKKDILIEVKNDSYLKPGAWNISVSWIERSISEARPIGQVGGDPVVKKLKEAYEEWKRTHPGDDSSSGEDW